MEAGKVYAEVLPHAILSTCYLPLLESKYYDTFGLSID